MVYKNCLKKLISFFDSMKNKKKVEILLKTIETVYTKNPGMQKLINESMVYNNVPSWLSPQCLCGNSCTLEHDVRLHITGTNVPMNQRAKECSTS